MSEPLHFDSHTAANSGWYSGSMPTDAATASNTEVLMDWQLPAPLGAETIDDDPATSAAADFDLDASANLRRGIQVTKDPRRFPAATRTKPGDGLAPELDRYLRVSHVVVLHVADYQEATFDPYEPGTVELEDFVARILRSLRQSASSELRATLERLGVGTFEI